MDVGMRIMRMLVMPVVAATVLSILAAPTASAGLQSKSKTTPPDFTRGGKIPQGSRPVGLKC